MLDRTVLSELRRIVGAENCLYRNEDLLVYSRDTFGYKPSDVVVLPRTSREVSEIVRIASRHALPITPRGAGTGATGASVPEKGGIILALTRMDEILSIDAEDRVGIVEPGVVSLRFQHAAEEAGLFYPPDPGSQMVCTLGGTVATNAGGPRAVKYGVTRNYLLGVEAVLASGEIVNLGGRQLKNVTGYDLSQLLCGSEGTLGIVTKILFRLLPRPQTTRTILAGFSSLEDAAEVVKDVFKAGILPAAMELMDKTFIRIAEERFQFGLSLDAEGYLLIEVDGFEESVAVQSREIDRLCRKRHPLSMQTASDREESQMLWKARRLGVMAVMRKYKRWVAEDATVPLSRIPHMIRRVRALSDEYDIPIIIFGHAGDGNLHPIFCFDPMDEKEVHAFELASRETFRIALELGGTLSGEHGIGLQKKDYLDLELSRPVLGAMQAIKHGLDPQGIFNPGKFV
jgi:glycolate oxidase